MLSEHSQGVSSVLPSLKIPWEAQVQRIYVYSKSRRSLFFFNKAREDDLQETKQGKIRRDCDSFLASQTRKSS